MIIFYIKRKIMDINDPNSYKLKTKKKKINTAY